MRRTSPRFPLGGSALLAAGAAILLLAGALWAHAVVVPGTSATRAYESYTLRVPNERDVPTTRVRIKFPPELFVMSFADVPGWDLEVERDSTGRAVGATWRGTLEPDRFVELPFVGVNPPEPATLVWGVDQAYQGTGGEEVVSWTGPPDSEYPASRTLVVDSAPAGGEDAGEGGEILPWIAVLLSLAALVVSIRALRDRRV